MTTLETDGALNLGGSNGGNGGFMNGDGWWAIILFALIFGYGRNGGGFGGGSYGGVADNYVLATDFATIERKLDGVNAGICDSTFALNNTIVNGFNNVQNTLCQGLSGINTALVTQGYETRLGTQALSSQLAQCCCDTQGAIANLNYNLATQNCATLQAIDKVGDRVIDYLTQGELRKYRDSALVAQIKNEVNPCAIPAYPVPNPNCCYNANVTFSNPYGNSCNC